MLGWLSLILFVAAGLNIFLGIVVLMRNWRLLVNRVFFVLTITVGLWDIGIGAFILVDSEIAAFAWAKLFYASALLLVLLLVYFAQAFPNEKRLPLKSSILFAVPVAVLVTLIYIWPGFILETIYVTDLGRGVAVNQVQYFVYGLVIIAYFGVSLLTLFTKSRKLNGTYRIQAWWFFVAGTITAAVGLWFDLILPHWLGDYSLVWVGPLATTLFAVWCAINIIRYGLFDIRQATMRAIAYTLTILTLATIYFILAFVITDVFLRIQPDNSGAVSVVNVSVALVLAFIFQPIKRFFDRVTNFVFYRDTYNPNEFFARLTHTLSTMTDLSTLLHYASSEISKTLKASFGAFFVYRTDKRPLYASTVRSKIIPLEDAKALDAYVTTHGSNILITTEISDEHDGKAIRRLLVGHRITLALPLKQDDSIIGYFFLGEHLSSEYTRGDIGALKTIVDALVIAIENALSIQEVRELNDTLQQRIDNATSELRRSNAQLQRLDKAKDDFISMASHQLRTPLTSIKGYISMVREGDAGKITKTQDQLLGQAFTSSERMVHLINDFLNVSRLQTGKFLIDKRPVNLAKVIEQELDSLVTNAKSRNLSFVYTPPKDFPLLNLDEDKMRQVIMNFSDNAMYYSTEGTKVHVKLALDKKCATFTVKDSGIGVPRSEQSQLFNKFYRASNARKQRPDGTGVGLYLAKKVIDAHAGTVVFESVEGKGSTFGFKLSLDELRVASDTNDLENQNNKS